MDSRNEVAAVERFDERRACYSQYVTGKGRGGGKS